jgi:precorrin-3B synthase
MASGDGLMIRVRAAARALRASELCALAELAQVYGNGQIELTRRANLQLRGIRAEALTALQSQLVRLGLADASPELERRLGLSLSPLASPELAALGGAIEAQLRAGGMAKLPELPSKFGIVLEGSDAALAHVYGDIRVELTGELAQLSIAGERASATWLGACRVQDAARAVVSLAQACAELGDDARRKLKNVDLRARIAAWAVAAPQPGAAAPAAPPNWVGSHAHWFGLGIPFGSASAETWFGAALLAERFGRGEIRTTPDRALLLPGTRATDHAELARATDRLGLIRDPRDPLLFVEACPGAPACASALGETRQLARALATELKGALGPKRTLHVSGCGKGCARSRACSVTLVRDLGGCRLGFDLDTALTSTRDVVPLEAARVELQAWASVQRDS